MENKTNKKSFSDVLAMSQESIKEEVVLGCRALCQFRLQRGESAVKPHIVRQVRRHIARLKTALKMKSAEQFSGE